MNDLISKIRQRFNISNIIERVIYINLTVFIITYVFRALAFLMKWNNNPIFDYFALSAKLDQFFPKFWTLFTYGFLHGGILHIGFNMLLLYYIGNLFLDFFSKKQFLTYYISGIIIGGAIFLISYNYLPALKNQSTILIGASAGVTAIVIGLATKIPNYSLRFRFIGNIKLWHIATLLVLIDIIQLPLGNTGGHLAHLGGAVIGFLLTNQFNDGKNLANYFSNLFKKKKQKPLKTVYKKNTTVKKEINNKDQEKIDAILDKISKSGYETLTQKEKDFLFSVGKKK